MSSEGSAGRRTRYDSESMILALPVKEALAKKLGIPFEEACYIYDQLGDVLYERLISGLPCGIPHIGTIFHSYYVNRGAESMDNPTGPRVPCKTFRTLLKCSVGRNRDFKLHVPYTGSLAHHVALERKRAREVRMAEAIQLKQANAVHGRPALSVRRKARILKGGKR